MISTIVLSKNNDDTLDACLRSVVDSLPYDKEVLVVDAHSTDNTPNILKKYDGKIRVVYDKGEGLGWSRNFGVRNATHDIIAFVDSDVICEKEHFLKIMNYFNEHPDIGALDTSGIHPMIGTKVQRLESLFWATAESGISSQVSLRGWSISFRRSAFDAVNGFRRGGADDNDFTYKLKKHGVKIASIRTNSWHMPRRTLPELIKEMELWGRMGAYLQYQWRSNRVFTRDMMNRRIFRILRNGRVMMFVAYLASPITGIKYLRKAKNFQLYLHFIVRQWAWTFGFIQGNFDIAFNHDRYLRAHLEDV